MKNPYVHTTDVHNSNAAFEILPLILNKFKINSILDIGCGIGTWLSAATNLGVKDIIGIDGHWVQKDLLQIEDIYFLEKDLTLPLGLNRKFDLVICLEVAEHLPENAADNLIQILTSHSNLILFSAAIPGQGGQNHLNEQPYKYWIDKFREKGFCFNDGLRQKIWNNPKIDWWYRQNIFIVSKENISPIFEISDTTENIYVHPEALRKYKDVIEKQASIIHNYNKSLTNPLLFGRLYLNKLVSYFNKKSKR